MENLIRIGPLIPIFSVHRKNFCTHFVSANRSAMRKPYFSNVLRNYTIQFNKGVISIARQYSRDTSIGQSGEFLW